MARPKKEGVEYFPLDCDFFDNIKVHKICRATNSKQSMLILIALLAFIYKGKGYYIDMDEDLAWALSEKTGLSEDLCDRTITAATLYGFFDSDMAESHKVLTSRSIQERYFYMKTSKNRRFKTSQVFPYLLEDILEDMHGESVQNVELCTEEGHKVNKTNRNNKVIRKDMGKVKVNERQNSDCDLFYPPTLEEVQDFVDMKGYTNVVPEDWYQYYSERDWVTSTGESMTNWRCSVGAWNKNHLPPRGNGVSPIRTKAKAVVAELIDEVKGGQVDGSY